MKRLISSLAALRRGCLPRFCLWSERPAVPAGRRRTKDTRSHQHQPKAKSSQRKTAVRTHHKHDVYQPVRKSAMDAFNYRDGELFAEGVALSAIAERFGTPTYVYSRAHIEAQYRAYADALAGMPHLVCFAVKANSNLGVLNVLARLGAGFDIVSRGELERVLAAGGSADKIVFSGVGKTREDMRRALEVGVHCFNVESTDELERLQVVAAELGVRAPVSLRVNPDVDAGTHPYISTGLKENKFGIAIADAEDVYIRAAQLPNLDVVGVDCHIGSQLTTLPTVPRCPRPPAGPGRPPRRLRHSPAPHRPGWRRRRALSR